MSESLSLHSLTTLGSYMRHQVGLSLQRSQRYMTRFSIEELVLLQSKNAEVHNTLTGPSIGTHMETMPSTKPLDFQRCSAILKIAVNTLNVDIMLF